MGQRKQYLNEVIRNTKSVVLAHFTPSLLSISQQYQQFVEIDLPPEQQIASALLVRQARNWRLFLRTNSEAVCRHAAIESSL